MIACVVLAAGIGISITAAVLWDHGGRKAERRSFQSTAADVTAALTTSLRRDADFVSTLRAVLTLEPQMSTSRFQTWFDQLSGAQRQAGTLGTVVIASVPRDRLRSFQAGRNADRTFQAVVGGQARTLAPVRGRSRYCLLSAVASLVALGNVSDSLQGDWCDTHTPLIGASAPELAHATDTGQFLAAPVSVYGLRVGFFDVAFYQPGTSHSTPAQRRRAVRGWIASSFNIYLLIADAIHEHTGLDVSLYHTNPGGRSGLVGEVGHEPQSGLYSRTAQISVEGPWTVVVRGHPVAHGLSPDLQSVLLLAGGSLVSVLFGILILVLSRGRARALGLVDEKTDLLAYQSLHDSLTGLPNRVLAMDRAEQMLVRARRTQLPVVGLYVDIDNLGQINDLFGHGLADQCVRIVADRLASVIRESDTVARVDGDEFFALLEGPMADPEPLLVAERMLEVVRQPPGLTENVGHLSLTVSIGLAQSVQSSPEVLLANAKVAQSVAKSAGKDQCVVFESGMLAAAHDRVALEMDLVDAFAEQQLFLAYQPIIELHDERPIGVEALLRWRHPERGIVSPAMFIPLAEESGLIVPIGKWVLAEACRQAAAWRGQGHVLGMSVNVSARQLDRDGLIEDVRDALRHSGLEPSALTIEITESALMVDADATAKRLAALKELGVRTAVDDFGTGYSSMAYLRQFAVDQLKIDRSFIQGITGSQRSAALVQTLVRLGKSLELETLAEGIEDREQLGALQDQSCDSGQGFLFARPLEPDAVIAWVEQCRQRNHPGALV